MQNLIPEKLKSGLGGKILRSILLVTVSFILLMVFLAFLLQTPPVQRYVKKMTVEYLEDKLGQRVEMDNLSLEWFNQLRLSRLYIEDSRQDTLLYIGGLIVNLNMNISSLLQNDFRFNGIVVEDVRFKNTIYPGDSLSSLSLALRKLNLKSTSDQTSVTNELLSHVQINGFNNLENPWNFKSDSTSKSKISLDLKSLELVNIHWTQTSPSASNDFYLQHGQLDIDQIDLENKILHIDLLNLDKPRVNLNSISNNPVQNGFKWFDDSTFDVQIRQLDIRDGQFDATGKSDRNLTAWTQLSNHLNKIEVGIDSLSFKQSQIRFSLRNLTAQDRDLMGIKSLKVEQVILDAQSIQLNGTNLLTRDSRIADSLQMKFDSFDDFKTFNDKIELNLNLKEVRIRLAELMAWVPNISKNRFFANHAQKDLEINGRFKGTINDLKASKAIIKIGEALTFNGDFDLNNLSVPGETFLSIRVKSLKTDIQSIKQLIGESDKFKNFDKLGKLHFKGNFDGSLEDFVAYGVLQTDIGQTKLDMRLNNRKGNALAKYSGEIELVNFDLGHWAGNAQLGKTNLSATISDGEGLTASTASATLHALINQIEYKGYTYTNMRFDGTLNQKLLDGRLIVRDEHVDLAFIGKIDFTNPIPAYNFIADVNHLDLHKINFSKSPLIFSGSTDISMQGHNLDEMTGNIRFSNAIIETDSAPVLLREMNLVATQTKEGAHKVEITSDWIDARLEGNYSFLSIWPSLKNQLINQFPEIAQTLRIKAPTVINRDSIAHQKYDFFLEVKEIKAINRLFKQDIAASKPFSLQGSINSSEKYLLANWNIPDFRWNDLNLYNAVGRLEAKGPVAYASTYIDSTNNKQFHMPHLILTADLSYNVMNFSIKTPEVSKYVSNVSINGVVRLIDSTWQFKLTPSNLSFLDKKWNILENNEINYRPGYINTRNLRFEHGNELIEITSIENKGLKVGISNLDVEWINKINPLPQWKVRGLINLAASVNDLFTLKGIRVSGQIDSFYINDTYYGLLDINGFNANLNQPITASLAMLNGPSQLVGEGFFDVSGKQSSGNKNNYQFKFLFKDYPLKIFEYLIDNVIDNTQGKLSGNFELNKVAGQPNFSGRLNIKEGSLKVNYLGTTYLIGNQPIVINNSIIDASGVTLKDELGNTAVIQGGFAHQRFKNFSLSAGITSNRFLVLKTTKDLNPDYYGTVVGNINTRFSGPFNRIDIDVQGATARPTILYIPLNQATEITSDRLVKYRPKQEFNTDKKPPRILGARGISVSIDLSIKNDSEIWVIFDEKRGDILKGRGTGDLQMKFDRNGGISMFGDYEVERGEYLFTLLGVVNKPFVIRQGGTIRWNGDPLGADINLDADYKGLTSTLINLLPEYENAIDNSELRTQSEVDLSMHLFGELFKPEISFNLDIPNLTGNLRSIVDNKLNLLKADQNALNQQVLGLMVWGSFLPPNQLVASSGVIGSTINNLSQFISNQLSILVENALKELVANNEVISGFDFDVNYYNNNNAIDINNLSVFDEVNINLGPRFFEDRLSVGVGANFVNSAIFNRLITPHFEVEYSLTKDRRLKIRAYAKKDDINQGQLKDRIGGGLSYRKEFDSIEDFKQRLKQDLEQKIPPSEL